MILRHPNATVCALLALVLCVAPASAADAELSVTGQDSLYVLELLVDGEWLEEHLGDPGLTVVDYGREIEDYENGHIPGAAWLPGSATMTQVGGTPQMLPHVESVVASLESVGVSDGETVVVYDEAGGLWASRLFWVLEYLGHDDVRILDGGWNQWAEEERDASYESPAIEPAFFTARVHPERLATFDWIIDHLDSPEFLPVDTRTLKEFTGETAKAPRGGHIPEAAHLNWEWTVEDDGLGVFLPPEEIEVLLDAAGITRDHNIATYCQAGVRAAHTYFVLRLMGFPCVRVYDGSWIEWGSHPDVPVDSDVPIDTDVPADTDAP